MKDLLKLVKISSVISPKITTKLLYKRAFAKKLDLKNPKTLNEKIQWLKLNTYYKNELVTACVDKYKVREYIKDKDLVHTLNELIGVWRTVEEIDWEQLPNKFVLKCNHGAGYNIVCQDKKTFNVESAKEMLAKWMKEDYWKLYAEVNYKYVDKRIICEKFIETKNGELPTDYKVYCFNGQPQYIMLCEGRETNDTKYYFVDRNWKIAPLNRDSMNTSENFVIEKPKNFDLLFKYAEILSEPFPFVRVDFYLENGEVYFGELTFTPGGGLDYNRLESTDTLFGNLLSL